MSAPGIASVPGISGIPGIGNWGRGEQLGDKPSGSGSGGGGGRRGAKGDRGGGASKPFALGPDGERQETSKVLDKDYKGKCESLCLLRPRVMCLARKGAD